MDALFEFFASLVIALAAASAPHFGFTIGSAEAASREPPSVQRTVVVDTPRPVSAATAETPCPEQAKLLRRV